MIAKKITPNIPYRRIKICPSCGWPKLLILLGDFVDDISMNNYLKKEEKDNNG